MAEPKSLFANEVKDAFGEWRNALSEVAPKVPFGPNYPAMLKEMKKDPRILDQVAKWREFYHSSEEGMEQQAAKRAAADDLTKFIKTFEVGG